MALEVARELVVYLKRPGNQAQFSVTLKHQDSDYKPIQNIKDWLLEHLKEKITVEDLAEQALMSPRNFARVFTRETKAGSRLSFSHRYSKYLRNNFPLMLYDEYRQYAQIIYKTPKSNTIRL